MIILRMYWRIRSLVKTLLYRVLFGGRFVFPFDSTFRRNFGVYLGKVPGLRLDTMFSLIVDALSTV